MLEAGLIYIKCVFIVFIRCMLRILLVSFAIVVTALLMTSCISFEGVHKYRVTYCDKRNTSLVKAVALKAIRLKYPGYPTEGLCAGLAEISKEE